MKYKIEIWQYCSKVEIYESNDLNEVLDWYKREWSSTYDDGDCSYEVYENGRQFSFDELLKFGFE